MGRNRRQVGKAPFAAFDIVFLRHGEFEQVADGRREHIVLALEIITRAFEFFARATQRLGNVLGDGGFFSDDELLGHF